jgi:GMP synthase (glutamine-hydrolysing)
MEQPVTDRPVTESHVAAPRILIADGTPVSAQRIVATFGAPTNAAMFETAFQLHVPDVRCTTVNIADGEDLPFGTALESFDAVVFTGSPLHIYDPSPAVTRQIDFARAAFATSTPVWGSCWGLQLATVALGGSVRRSPNGRELGIARRIILTASGRSHPLLAARPLAYDALCSHLDEVDVPPERAEVLAGNNISAVQAMAVPTPGGGEFVGVQYHPEHDLTMSAALIQMRPEVLVAEGLAMDSGAAYALADDYRALHADPNRPDLRWRYGLDAQVLDPRCRTADLGAWLRGSVLKRARLRPLV